MSVSQWQSFANWMKSDGLITKPVQASVGREHVAAAEELIRARWPGQLTRENLGGLR